MSQTYPIKDELAETVRYGLPENIEDDGREEFLDFMKPSLAGLQDVAEGSRDGRSDEVLVRGQGEPPKLTMMKNFYMK